VTGITKEQEAYFFPAMLKLAEKFEMFANYYWSLEKNPLFDNDALIESIKDLTEGQQVNAILQEADPALLRLKTEYLSAVDALYEEVEQAGIDDCWNDMALRSGMQEKMERAMNPPEVSAP